MAEIPKTPSNNPAIVAAIENAKGPVGPGHHNEHRTANITSWLQSKEKKGGKGDPKDAAYKSALMKKAK